MVEIAIDGHRWRQDEIFFPINDHDQKRCILQESKEAEANRWRGWEGQDTTTHAKRISKNRVTKRRRRRRSFCLAFFVFVSFLLHQSIIFLAHASSWEHNKKQTRNKIKQFAMTPMIVDNEKLERDRTCGFVSYCLGTFPRSTVLILEFSLHQIWSSKQQRFRSHQRFLMIIDRLLPVWHVERACNWSTLTIAC